MLRVFICYGGRKGENVGTSLRNFLRNEGLRAFLANPRSPDIPAGVDYDKFIIDELLSSDLMIPICDSGIHRSKPALKEIQWALSAPRPVPIVAFVKKRCRLPKLIKDKWEPIRFNPKNLKSGYQRLLIEIYRRIDYGREQTEDLRMTRPTEFLVPKALKRLFLRRKEN